jgi:hypothetical protein
MSEWLDAAQATPPGDLHFTYQTPAGDTFVTTAANVEQYLRLGYTVTGEQTISDSETYRDLVSPGTNLPPASGTEAPPAADAEATAAETTPRRSHHSTAAETTATETTE